MKMTYLALGKACAKCNFYPLLKISTILFNLFVLIDVILIPVDIFYEQIQ